MALLKPLSPTSSERAVRGIPKRRLLSFSRNVVEGLHLGPHVVGDSLSSSFVLRLIQYSPLYYEGNSTHVGESHSKAAWHGEDCNSP